MGDKNSSDVADKGWNIMLSSGGGFYWVDISDGINQVRSSCGSTNIWNLGWVMVTYRFDRINGLLKTYLNGNYNDNLDISSVTGSIDPGSKTMDIGKDENGYFNGRIDVVQI